MSSQADTMLVRRDRAVRGLETVLDSTLFAEFVAEASEGRIAASQLSYARYKPGTSCVVGFRALIQGSEVPSFAIAASDDALPKLEGILRRHRALEPHGLRPLTIRRHGLLIAPFTADRRVRGLAKLRADGRRRLLNRLAPDARCGDRATAVVPLSYKPERRFVGRIDFQSGPPLVLRAFERDGHAFEAGLAALRTAESLGPGLVPRLVGRSRRHRLLMHEWLDGPTFEELASRGELGGGHVAALGGALATLHRGDVGAVRSVGRAQNERLKVSVDAVAALLPSERDRALALAQRVTEVLDGVHSDRVLVHGDLSLDQIVWSGKNAAFIDLDSMACDAPLADLGSLVASAPLRRFEGTLLRAYSEAGGVAEPRGLSCFAAAALLRRAVEPFRRRRPNWPDEVRHHLSDAESWLRSGD